jgi:hypothetical protein
MKVFSHTEQFKDNPESFLANFVVIADAAQQAKTHGAVSAEPKKFFIKHEQKNVCTLRFAGDDATDFIKAYWLPWKSSNQTSIQLGGEAEFFFTSEMTNCRFSVLSEGTTPRVAHIAGNEMQRCSEGRRPEEGTTPFRIAGEDPWI